MQNIFNTNVENDIVNTYEIHAVNLCEIDETFAKEIKNAKKDRALLLVMLREINTKSQSYTEKMQKKPLRHNG